MTEAACPDCGHLELHQFTPDGFRCTAQGGCKCLVPHDLPDWYEKHVAQTGGLNLQGFMWILSRPESVQRLLVKYPPGCVVQIRATGAYGINLVGSFLDQDKPTLCVGEKPGTKTGTEFPPEELEVVGYWNGLTPEAVEGIFDASKQQAVLPKADGPGRNDPCPCGSGAKFKKCHGGAKAKVATRKLIVPESFKHETLPTESPTEGLN